ncbi:MAG: hypothetical protein QXH07_07440 [Thermoplasmata archaeon]
MSGSGIKMTEGEMSYIQYCINGIMKEIQTDSIDLGYITEKLNIIKDIIERVAEAQMNAEKNR